VLPFVQYSWADSPKSKVNELKLVQQAHAALQRDGEQREMIQQVSQEMIEMSNDLVQETRLLRQAEHKLGQQDGVIDRKEQQRAEEASGRKSAEAALRQEKVLGRENARQVKDYGADRVRWEKQREKDATRAANVRQKLVADAESEKQRRKQLEAIVAATAGESRTLAARSRKVERELRVEQERNSVLSHLPHRGMAQLMAEAAVAQKEAAEQRAQREAWEQRAKEAEQREAKEAATSLRLRQRLKELEEQVAACTGKRSGRGRLKKHLAQVLEQCRSHWMDVRRRDLVREQDEMFDGCVDDLMQERDALEDTVRDLKGQLEQAAGKEQLLNELQSKMAKVPIMKRVGRTYPNQYKLLLMSMVGNSSSAYQARTLCKFMANFTLGWAEEGKDFEVPEISFLKDMRRDIQPMSETLSALKVARCERIVQLGSDGSSLGGTNTYTVNLRLFTRCDSGGRLLRTGEVEFFHEDVCLSASALPVGQSSDQDTDCIELLFERGREKIRLLRTQLEADDRDPDALGIPKPEECTLAKLAGGSLMNDTCNGARCTAKKIKERLLGHAMEYYGEERWGEMSQEEREGKSQCMDLLCWAHLRNLFIGEGGKEEKKYIKAQLKVVLAIAISYSIVHTQ
jgi:hypothetical protein